MELSAVKEPMTGYDGYYKFYESGVPNVERAVDPAGNVRYRTVKGAGVGWGNTPEEALAIKERYSGSSAQYPRVTEEPEVEAMRLLADGYPYVNAAGKRFYGDEARREFDQDTFPLNNDTVIGRIFKKLGL